MKRGSFLFVFFCFFIETNAQFTRDAGGWFSTKVSFEGKDGRVFYFAPEVRLDENLTRVGVHFQILAFSRRLSKACNCKRS